MDPNRMRVLFVHQNYPAQFAHLAPALQARGAEVMALSMQAPGPDRSIAIRHSASKYGTSAKHPWARDFETKVIRAEATLRTAKKLRDDGFSPDVIFAHPGWGDSLFLKQVWPEARLAVYCEYYYRSVGGDLAFDPEFKPSSDPLDAACQFKLRNLPQRLNLELATGALSPTEYQAGTYPDRFRPMIEVIHDGIDTDRLRPDRSAGLKIGERLTLTRDHEVVTFVARNLEPYRGYHIFTRALPELLRRRPNAHVVIVGGNDVSYGAKPPTGNWRDIFWSEIVPDVDRSRVHFVGTLPYDLFVTLMRVSSLHVYLTYPFVLSWSLLEAMALGAPILASETAPLLEVVEHQETGLLFPFFDKHALVDGACAILEDDRVREKLTGNARALVRERYDLHSVCLPRQIEWLERVRRSDPVLPEMD